MDLCISELQQEWPECLEHNAPFNFCISSNCDFQVCTGICCLDFCPGSCKNGKHPTGTKPVVSLT